jgi:hypothetical protein
MHHSNGRLAKGGLSLVLANTKADSHPKQVGLIEDHLTATTARSLAVSLTFAVHSLFAHNRAINGKYFGL